MERIEASLLRSAELRAAVKPGAVCTLLKSPAGSDFIEVVMLDGRAAIASNGGEAVWIKADSLGEAVARYMGLQPAKELN